MANGPWTIYARQLFPLSYGHPLWRPEPCLTFGEVHLGDVGYLEDGHFCLLFNATQSSEHPVNSLRGVPDGFQPLDIPDHMIRRRPNEITQPLLHSKSLKATSVKVDASVEYVYSFPSEPLQTYVNINQQHIRSRADSLRQPEVRVRGRGRRSAHAQETSASHISQLRSPY